MELKMSVASLFQQILMDEKVNHNPPTDSQTMLKILLRHGFDYFEMMRIIAAVEPSNFTEDELENLISSIPPTVSRERVSTLKVSVVRSMIPRWTGTRYHSGNINVVLQEIQRKCDRRETGIYVYNSNRNVKNRRAANDPYLLCITTKQWCFMDLNRRRIYQSASAE